MRAREVGLRIARPSRERPSQTAAQAQSTDALANQAGRGGVMGMPGQGMATAGAPVKERGQKGPASVANGAGEGEAESARAMHGLSQPVAELRRALTRVGSI